MSTLANASWMSKSSCLVTRFLIFFFLCINVHLFSLNQIIHYKIYWKGRHYPTTRICSKCNLAPVKCDLPWMLHVLFRGFMCIVIHKWDCVCPWTWSLYYVWCNKSVVLWRSSFHVKMESMNKLGDGTHLAGTLAGAKPWMSVLCWPGYATYRSSFIMNSQPNEVTTWANTEQGVVPHIGIVNTQSLRQQLWKKQVNHTY